MHKTELTLFGLQSDADAGEDGVGLACEDGIHFACHAETTLLAEVAIGLVDALGRTATVAIDEIADPASAGETERQHVLQT